MQRGLRNRKNQRGTGEEGMDQPLLGDEGMEEEAEASQPLLPQPTAARHRQQQQQIIPHPGPFNLQAFVCSILLWSWNTVIGAVYSCLSTVLPLPALPSATAVTPLQVTALQEHEMDNLRSRAAQSFNPEDEDDREALRRLWGFAFPQLPCTSLKSAQWKEMGWQGEDPATDFRGSGRLGLDCLLYLAEAHPSTFARLMHKSEGERSDWEYPFAVAGLNVTFTLLEVVGLQPSAHTAAAAAAGSSSSSGGGGLVQRVLKAPAGRGLVGLMAREEEERQAGGSGAGCVFYEAFVAAFEALDREWLRQRASYMQFNQVLLAVKSQLSAALSARPGSVAQLRAQLLPAPA